MPRIHNLDLDEKEKEYMVVLPKQTTKVTVQLRPNPLPDGSYKDYPLRLAFQEGQTTVEEGTHFFSVRPGATWWEDEMGHHSRSIKLYLRCPTADNQRAEIIMWP